MPLKQSSLERQLGRVQQELDAHSAKLKKSGVAEAEHRKNAVWRNLNAKRSQLRSRMRAARAVVDLDEVAALARVIVALPRLRLRGLMTVPPQHGAPERWFAELEDLRARMRAEGIELDALSMGMSADFEAAIAAGASLIRIGTAIFGDRAA
jgi:uncharacterized pyridoxal phosphate-containing UPF0001 family protein